MADRESKRDRVPLLIAELLECLDLDPMKVTRLTIKPNLVEVEHFISVQTVVDKPKPYGTQGGKWVLEET